MAKAGKPFFDQGWKVYIYEESKGRKFRALATVKGGFRSYERQ